MCISEVSFGIQSLNWAWFILWYLTASYSIDVSFSCWFELRINSKFQIRIADLALAVCSISDRTIWIWSEWFMVQTMQDQVRNTNRQVIQWLNSVFGSNETCKLLAVRQRRWLSVPSNTDGRLKMYSSRCRSQALEPALQFLLAFKRRDIRIFSWRSSSLSPNSPWSSHNHRMCEFIT